MPQGMDAEQYRAQMLQHMGRKRSQTARIWSTTEPRNDNGSHVSTGTRYNEVCRQCEA